MKILVIAIAALLAGSTPVQGKVKMSGYLTSGLKGDPDGESFYKVRLKFKSKRVDGIRAVAAIDGESDDDHLGMKDAYIDIKEGAGRILIGQAKKRFGLEYEEGKKERLTVRRSPLYQKLEEFSFVGREGGVRYISGDADKDLSYWRAGLGYNETQDASLLLSFSRSLEPASRWFVFGLIQDDRIHEDRQLVWALDGGYLWEAGLNRFVVEAMAGKDPVESEYEKTYGDGRAVLFSGIKIELAMEWTARVQPLLQLTHVAHDLDEVSAKSSTGLMGVNFWHSKALRLALNLESTSHEGKVAGSKSRHDFGAFEALYLF